MSWAAVRQALWPQRDGRSESQVDSELDEEFAFHLAMLQREGREQGMHPDAARELALARFGDRVRIRNECRRIALKERIMLQRIHLAITILLVLALGAMTFISMTMYRQASQARDAAVVQMVAARAQQEAAETERQKAETMQRLITQMLATPANEQRIGMKELLDQAELRLKDEFADQPDLAAQMQANIRNIREQNESGRSVSSTRGIVTVWGLVGRPGTFNLDPDDRLTLRRLLAAAGAPTSTPAVVDVDRFDGKWTRLAAQLTFHEDGSVEGEDLRLKPSDMVIVRHAAPNPQQSPK